MLNLQSNTQRGRKVFQTQTSFSGLEGLLAKITNVSGAANLALPAALTDHCNWVIEDGGFVSSPAEAFQAAATPLWAERNFRVWLNGTCNPGDQLVLANPVGSLAGGSFTTPDGGVFTTPAGFVQALPVLGSGLVLGAITLSSGKITAVAVTSGGSGYTNGQQLSFTDSSGYGATATLVVASGIVTGVTVADGGAGYTAPSATVLPPGVAYRSVGVAEEAGVSNQLVLLRPSGGGIIVV